MAASKKDLLQTFIENDRKAKTTTTIVVVGFLLCAGVIIHLAVELKKANMKITELNDQAVAALSNADEEVQSLGQNQLTIEKRSKTFTTEQQSVSGRGYYLLRGPRTNGNTFYQLATIYVQYQTPYRDLNESIRKTLLNKGARVPDAQLVDNVNFTSSVRYFNEADKSLADSIATLVNASLIESGRNQLSVTRNQLSAPVGQIEVWLGDYQKLNPKQLIKKYTKAP